MPISTFGRFDPELESFATYEERIRLFFEANDIAEEKKVPIFSKYNWDKKLLFAS